MAQVIDIRSPSDSIPKTVVVDANVLYFVHYDFESLSSAGVDPPSYAQRQPYLTWVKRALGHGVVLCAAATTFGEFVHLVERMELHCCWETDPQRPELDPDNPGRPFSPKYVKRLRYHYGHNLATIRGNVETYLQSARKTVELLPSARNVDPFGAMLQTWRSSTADIGDAALVTEARLAGVSNIISDDADFVTFEGIQLYTANRAVLAAASEARKLTRVADEKH